MSFRVFLPQPICTTTQCYATPRLEICGCSGLAVSQVITLGLAPMTPARMMSCTLSLCAHERRTRFRLTLRMALWMPAVSDCRALSTFLNCHCCATPKTGLTHVGQAQIRDPRCWPNRAVCGRASPGPTATQATPSRPRWRPSATATPMSARGKIWTWNWLLNGFLGEARTTTRSPPNTSIISTDGERLDHTILVRLVATSPRRRPAMRGSRSTWRSKQPRDASPPAESNSSRSGEWITWPSSSGIA
jgi:hypothetical protein